jgi:hypothetical protein
MNMQLIEENNSLRMVRVAVFPFFLLLRVHFAHLPSKSAILNLWQQLHAATTSVPLAQRLRSYVRSLFAGFTGLSTVCSSMLIAAASLGLAITMGQFGNDILICCCPHASC